MIRLNRLPVILAFILLTISSGYSATAPRSLKVPFVSKGPRLTGTLQDPLWQKAVVADHFTSVTDSPALSASTTAYLLRDSKYLYIGFRCQEPAIKSIVTKATQRDGAVYHDDCIQVLLDTNHDLDCFYHLIVNARGTISDSRRRKNTVLDEKWNLDFSVKTGIFKNYWIAELAIPFNSVKGNALNVSPVPGDCWGVNLCRERHAGTRESSVWNPVGKANDPYLPDTFGDLYFGGPFLTPEYEFSVLSWGELRTDANQSGGNLFKATVKNRMARNTTLEAALHQKTGSKWSSIFSIPIVLEPLESNEFMIPYGVKGLPGERFAITVTEVDSGRRVFRTEHPIVDFNRY